ncbi:hypothetical protein BCR42DRAFT_452348 [Absidia repens]|uniref:Galactose oxidase n=1 Tax=Absidia repens TaxID=90262 RepID=A0A1X2IDK5_9FUNG|nr:hypothetical protein BCR42DRAFT_452348 [Absidia repens]
MLLLFFTACIVFINHATFISAITIMARGFTGCSLVLDQIHCFGGYIGVSQMANDSYLNPLSDHFILDLSQFDLTDTSTGYANWTILQPTGSSPKTPVGFPQTASIDGKKKFIVFGGASGQQVLQDPVMVYDPANDNWSSIPTYGNYTRFGTIVDIPQSQTLWSWGGQYNNTWVTAPYVNILEYVTNTWKRQPIDTSNNYSRYQHTATFVESTNTIYIIGGYNTHLYVVADDVGAPMLEVRTFNTLDSTWGVNRASTADGRNISTRTQHTATYIPNSNSILIYGGASAESEKVVMVDDYAYLYDYSTNKYTFLNLAPESGAGKRKGHSAISYKSYVMIMFGLGTHNNLFNDLHVLNLSNLTNIHWLTASTSDPSRPVASDADSGLSRGAIAGIAVAAAVVFIGVIAGIIFIFRRKNQQKKNNQAYNSILTTNSTSQNDSTHAKLELESHTVLTDATGPVKPHFDENENQAGVHHLRKPFADEDGPGVNCLGKPDGDADHAHANKPFSNEDKT